MSIVGGLESTANSSFTEMLALLSDPTALAARHEALDAREKEVSALIALVGPASEVLQIREQLKADQQRLLEDRMALQNERRNVLAQAQVEAENIVRAAKATEDDIQRAAQEQLVLAQADRQAALMESITASNHRVAIEGKQKELDSVLAECKAKSAALDKDRQSHARAREALSERAKRLQDAIDGVK